jgi:hypothetical protein
MDRTRHRKTDATKNTTKSAKIGILRRLGPKKPTGYARGGWGRRRARGLSKGRYLPFLSVILNTPMAPWQARGRRIANACGDHRQPLKFRQHGSILGRKILQNRRLGPSWRRLGASWRPLGHVLGRLQPSWAVLEASWAVLEASWRRLGLILGASWGPSWASWGPRQAQKFCQDDP